MSNQITSSDNIIDSRDVIARIEELEVDESELQQNIDEIEDQFEPQETTPLPVIEAKKALKFWQESEEGQELAALKNLQAEAQHASDWEYGAQLINEDYFETAMDELLEDIGDIPRDLPCYLTIVVDYDALKQDYMEVTFDGTTFLVRA